MAEPLVNGIEVDMCSSPSPSAYELGTPAFKPRFLASFMVDARGSSVRGSRHSGVHIIIPAGKVCMPTRMTCKLIKSDKLTSPPTLKEGEAIVSRVLELGPAGTQFNGPVLIELPHIASFHNNEREVIVLRSDDGVAWHEHPVSSSDIVNSLLKCAGIGEHENTSSKPTFNIVSTDFPRYFALVSRVRQLSRMIGRDGGSLVSDVEPSACAVFPIGSVTKDTKVGLQVLPVATQTIEMVLGSEGQQYGTSPVITVEPRRRRFHAPISLTIPLPKTVVSNKPTKQAVSGLRLLYSITGGANVSQWEDITGSAPMNIIKDCVSFSTTVSARFWLVDCGAAATTETSTQEIISSATSVYREIIAVPIMAYFVVFARRHHETEAQLRVLCLTEDLDFSTTLEYQEKFREISRSQPVELMEGKSYSVELSGNLVPAAASSSQLGIEFRAFRINRLSFVIRIRDILQIPEGCLTFLPALKVDHGLEPQHGAVLCSLPVSLFEAKPTELFAACEPEEELVRQFEVARQQAALAKEQESCESGAGVTLRLGDIAVALKSDWLSVARQLGITDPEVIMIQKDFGNVVEQAMLMLHLWVAKANGRVVVGDLEAALRRIGRDDVINRCIKNMPNDGDLELTNGDIHEDVVQPIDSPSDDPSAHRAFNMESYILQENDHKVNEFEESAVYQIEEVWDGTQWHKSMKMVPTSGDAVLEEGVSVSVIESHLPVEDEQTESVQMTQSRVEETEASSSVAVPTEQTVIVTQSTEQDVAGLSDLGCNSSLEMTGLSADVQQVHCEVMPCVENKNQDTEQSVDVFTDRDAVEQLGDSGAIAVQQDTLLDTEADIQQNATDTVIQDDTVIVENVSKTRDQQLVADK
jgi:ankyrin